jgi:hypothetical protein
MMACYCRVSTRRQKADSQKADIQRWLTGHAVPPTAVQWFEDGSLAPPMRNFTRRRYLGGLQPPKRTNFPLFTHMLLQNIRRTSIQNPMFSHELELRVNFCSSGARDPNSSNTYQHPSGPPAVTRSTTASPEFILLTITTSPGWRGAARLLSSKRTHLARWGAPCVPATTTSGSSTAMMVRRSSRAYRSGSTGAFSRDRQRPSHRRSAGASAW